jgi:hypothetical protein
MARTPSSPTTRADAPRDAASDVIVEASAVASRVIDDISADSAVQPRLGA